MQNDKQQGLLFLFFFSVEKIKRCISKPPSLRIEALLSWTKSTALSIKKKKKHGAAFFSFASLSLKQLLNRLSHISKLSLTHTHTQRDTNENTNGCIALSLYYIPKHKHHCPLVWSTYHHQRRNSLSSCQRRSSQARWLLDVSRISATRLRVRRWWW